MIDAGILDGDYVVVQKQQTARDGDIVVALAGEDEAGRRGDREALLRENGRIRLPARERDPRAAYPTHVQISRQGDRGLQAGLMTEIVALNRTLTRAPGAHARREPRVPVCSEFVLHTPGRSSARSAGRASRRGRNRGYNSRCRPGDRGPGFGGSVRGKSDTAGQDAGEIPGGESRRKVAQKGDRQRRTSLSGDAEGKGEGAGGVRARSAVVTRRLAKPRPVQGEQAPLEAARRGAGCVARAAGEPVA